jgi:thymidine phosphorylase
VTDAVSVITAKRDGRRLADDDIRWLFEAYAAGQVADEQMSALLMAIFFQGLDGRELRTWTAAMIDSGERLDLSGVPRPTVDKHSTGGVGDKVSLILAPLVAACGAAVPQLSGRGLGFTGGTLDKLESIPGWQASLTTAQTIDVLKRTGAVICAAGAGLAPADRRLYALRDVTGTVESIPLIASSIMSKKIAEGTSALVLDVKVGTGAFMKDLDRARELARTMVALGTEHGVRTTALLTRMDVPLGRAVGNAVEVEESVRALQGDGPDDLMRVTLALAGEMLSLVGIDADPSAAIASGRAYAAYQDMIRAQGGDPDAPLPRAPYSRTVAADRSGWVTRLDALQVGIAGWRLGAGRARKEDPVSASAGVICLAKPGDQVSEGQPILELRADDESRFAGALAALGAAGGGGAGGAIGAGGAGGGGGAIGIGPEPPAASPDPVIDRVVN